jgi:regulator of replication initiation timing
MFLEWKIHLNGLVFVGEEIPKDNRFKENTVVLGLMEGFYTSLDSIVSDELLNQLCLPQEFISVTDISNLRNSYCLNVLYRIEMMQRVITQTLILVNNTRTKLEEKLSFMLDRSELKSKVECMEMRVKSLKNQLFFSTERLNNSQETKVKNESDICEKGIDMLNKFQHLKMEREKLMEKRKKFDQSRERLVKTKAQLMIRRKQLITDIAKIYPLVPFPDGNGGFSICGVHLPNSEDFEGHDETMISIAIGYVAHILVMISRLLDVSLRYQIIYYGSHSSVIDHLNDKISENDRIFPLHAKRGKDKLHFKYGVFLINKNIAQLRHYLGLHTRDLSATLPNLYSLLREKLIFLNEETSVEPIASSSSNTLNTTSSGHIDDYLRRELEVMRNQQELQEAGPSKSNSIHMRKLSNISNNSIHLVNESKTLSLSLDKGLNEIVTHKKNVYTDESVSSSLSSNANFNPIPKHLLNSNQFHHNLSEADLDRIVDQNKSKHQNHQMKWSEESHELINGSCGASSSDSSPRVDVWTEPNINSEHSEKN